MGLPDGRRPSHGAGGRSSWGARWAATNACYDAGGYSAEIAQRKYRQIRAGQAREAAMKVRLGARPTPLTPEPAADNVVPLRKKKQLG